METEKHKKGWGIKSKEKSHREDIQRVIQEEVYYPTVIFVIDISI